MARPFSGKELRRLGRRLAQPGLISDEDYEMLARVAEAYQAVLDKVEEKLQELGYQATTRVKTTGTLIDKLRRTPHLSLGGIHDVAGARIVLDGGRREQDQVAERIMTMFADCPRAPEKIDRREQPSHGYRAVHVVVFEDSTPVEIQIRTKFQDVWAQISEKLGDRWGRGLRYGEGPDLPDEPAGPPFGGVSRREVVEVWGEIADDIAAFEVAEAGAAQATGASLEALEQAAVARVRTQAILDRLMEMLAALGGTQ
jgi:hypothetical protein